MKANNPKINSFNFMQKYQEVIYLESLKNRNRIQSTQHNNCILKSFKNTEKKKIIRI